MRWVKIAMVSRLSDVSGEMLVYGSNARERPSSAA
jgi:hypothetical protein